MAVNIPTFKQLYDDIIADLEAELNITIPIFGKSFLRAFAVVQASKQKLYYLSIANLQKNIFVDTAEPEALGGTLERYGRIKLGRSPYKSTPGSYQVSVTGDIGAVIPVNTTFKSSDTSTNPGKLYVLDAEYTFVAGVNLIIVRALEGGLDSQLSIGDIVTSTSPIANAESKGAITNETIEPLAAETVEEYRAKAIQAYQLEPQGGAAADYILWAEDAQGLKRVYPYTKSGFSNEIQIFIEATVADSIDGKGTPSAALIQEVDDVTEFDPDNTKPISERGRRPIGVFNIDFLPIILKTVDVEIINYANLTPTIESSISNSITSFVDTVRPFVDNADVLADKNDILSINNLISVILKAVPGGVFEQVILRIDGVELPTFSFQFGDIPTVDSITFSTNV